MDALPPCQNASSICWVPPCEPPKPAHSDISLSGICLFLVSSHEPGARPTWSWRSMPRHCPPRLVLQDDLSAVVPHNGFGDATRLVAALALDDHRKSSFMRCGELPDS